MSCLGPGYNPQPPREWYRFENRQPDQLTETTTRDTNGNGNGRKIYIPILKTYVDDSVGYQDAVYKKGNILQYKANSASFTKAQTYSQIAQGNWQNRTKTWSSQSIQNSDPNTASLKRVNYTYSYLNSSTGKIMPAPDNASFFTTADCYASSSLNTISQKTFSSLPQVITSTTSTNALPEQNITTTSSSTNPLTTLIPGSSTNQNIILIQDGGSLVGNITVDPCTGETIKVSRTIQCTPSTGSNVPGPAVSLCWNSRLQTYYPRVRRTYTDAGNKFPTNDKLLFSANSIQQYHHV
jgi:hypothetical protein